MTDGISEANKNSNCPGYRCSICRGDECQLCGWDSLGDGWDSKEDCSHDINDRHGDPIFGPPPKGTFKELPIK